MRRAIATENRALLALAVPTIVASLTVPAVGLTDTWIMGRLPGAVPLAAVGLGASFIGLLSVAGYPFRGVSVALTAQWLARGEEDRVRAWVRAGLRLSGLGLGATALLAWPLAQLASRAYGLGGELAETFTAYVGIRIFELPFMVSTLFTLGALRGAQDARSPMAVALAIAGANVALNFLTVFGLGWGAAGSAAASALANALGAAAAWRAYRRAFPAEEGRVAEPGLTILARARGALGWSFGRSLVLMGALACFAALAGRLGVVQAAAHGVLIQLWLLSSYAVDGFAIGAESRLAHHAGRGDGRALPVAAWVTLVWCVAVAGAFGLAYALAPSAWSAAFSGEPAVRRAVLTGLPWVAALQPIVAVAYWADSVLIALVALRASFVALAAGAVTFAGVYPPVAGLGLGGLWGAIGAFSAVRAAAGLGASVRAIRRAGAESGDAASRGEAASRDVGLTRR